MKIQSSHPLVKNKTKTDNQNILLFLRPLLYRLFYLPFTQWLYLLSLKFVFFEIMPDVYLLS